MSESESGNGGATANGDPNRSANEAVGERIRDLLIGAGFTAGIDRPADEPWELGRLLRAYVRVGDPRIRAEIISLLEAIGLFQSAGRSLPRS